MPDRDAQDAWLAKVLGISRQKPASAAGGGLAAWQAARAAAIAQLKTLEGKIAGLRHPRSAAAIILVKSIQMNLTAAPSRQKDVAELERYLTTDDIIAEAERPNGFGVKIELREPLLAALGSLKAGLPA